MITQNEAILFCGGKDGGIKRSEKMEVWNEAKSEKPFFLL